MLSSIGKEARGELDQQRINKSPDKVVGRGFASESQAHRRGGTRVPAYRDAQYPACLCMYLHRGHYIEAGAWER
jgi:hypothetical protein